MILRKLSLRNFRRFERFEASFTPGLNLIFGHNEEGKSTIREALTIALFQDPKTSDKKVLALRRWGATAQFAIDLEFEIDGHVYLLAKDFESKSVRLIADYSDSERQLDVRSQDFKAVDAVVGDFLGVPSKTAFESTVRVSQRDITRLQNGKEIADRLQETVTGGEQEVQASRVMVDLDKAFAALRSAGRANPGPLYIIPLQLRQLEESANAKRRQLATSEAAATGLVAAQKSLREAEARLAEQLAMEKACGARLRVEDELGQAEHLLAKVEDTLDEAERLAMDLFRGEQELAQYRPVLAMTSTQMGATLALEAQAVSEEEAGAAPPSVSASSKPIRPVVLAAGLALLLIGLVVTVAANQAGVVLAFFGAAVVIWDWLRSQRLAAAEALARDMRSRERRAEAAEARRRLADILSGVGCSTVDELRGRRAAGEACQGRLSECRGRLAGLLRGQTMDELQSERKIVSRQVRDLQERLAEPALRLAQIDHAGYQRLQTDIERQSSTIATLRKDTEDQRVTVRANQIGVDEIHRLDERADELRERLRVAQDRSEMLALVKQVLGEARDATMVSARDVLERELGGLVAKITAGRYTKVRVDPGELSIELMSPDRALPVPVVLDGDLSQGTVEQIYLAARLALARLVCKGRRPPFLLDDPFVTFDPLRAAAVLGLCKRMSREQQMLLFSCHPGYEAVADHVIRLPSLLQPVPSSA